MSPISQFNRGIIFSVLSAVFYGCVTTFARISYEEGSNSLTVGISRSVFGMAICLILLFFQGKIISLSKHASPGIVIVSLFTSGIALAYLGSVQFIPVGISAILFFTWPILLLLYLAIRQPGTISVLMLICFVLAFAGLFFVIGPVFTNLNPIGVVLALIAACCAAGLFVASQNFFESLDLIVAAFWVNLCTLIIISAITFSTGEFQLPNTTKGYWALFFASGGYAFGLLTMFLAINTIGAARSAIYFNLEPVIAILAAKFLLGESLTTIQLLGFVVIMSILFYTSFLKSQWH